MKRFLMVNDYPWDKSYRFTAITKETLARVKERECLLFDLIEHKYFNPDENKWVDIPDDPRT